METQLLHYWDTRKEMVDEFMQELVKHQYPVTSAERSLLECFWTFILAKQMGVIHGQE